MRRRPGFYASTPVPGGKRADDAGSAHGLAAQFVVQGAVGLLHFLQGLSAARRGRLAFRQPRIDFGLLREATGFFEFLVGDGFFRHGPACRVRSAIRPVPLARYSGRRRCGSHWRGRRRVPPSVRGRWRMLPATAPPCSRAARAGGGWIGACRGDFSSHISSLCDGLENLPASPEAHFQTQWPVRCNGLGRRAAKRGPHAQGNPVSCAAFRHVPNMQNDSCKMPGHRQSSPTNTGLCVKFRVKTRYLHFDKGVTKK